MDDYVSLLDWRRQLSALYQSIRDAPNPQAAHKHWQQERNRLLTSPVSPWAGGEREHYVRVEAEVVSGRRIIGIGGQLVTGSERQLEK